MIGFVSSRNSQISTVARTKFRAQKDAMKIIIPLACEKGLFGNSLGNGQKLRVMGDGAMI
jgi:hypothetical protein